MRRCVDTSIHESFFASQQYFLEIIVRKGKKNCHKEKFQNSFLGTILFIKVIHNLPDVLQGSDEFDYTDTN
ncbi:hypothetical protein RclHR1_03130004 [Rhizophagus clarus]|uniref:Uncharacterized protein n=1 Tax=Rhizophagus clarus TaxID=94130 RepID=A0A2Z6R775_9GLOM|nr:hypothetical protein RclHR1_03130004 [Rhizophagus clarus]